MNAREIINDKCGFWIRVCYPHSWICNWGRLMADMLYTNRIEIWQSRRRTEFIESDCFIADTDTLRRLLKEKNGT